MSAYVKPLESASFFEKLGRLLSEESAANFRQELSFLKNNIPPVLDSSCQPIHFIPTELSTCQAKLRRVLRRLSWTQQISDLECTLRRSSQQKVTTLKRVNEELNEKIEELQKELQRSRHQLQSLLGLTTQKLSQGDEESPSGEPSPPKAKKHNKRGAPKGHRGATRGIPEKVDHVEWIPPPEECTHCHRSEIVLQDHFVSKFIEDIPPLLKTVLEKRYQTGVCSACGKEVIEPQATIGPPVSIGQNLRGTLCLLRQRMGISYRKLSYFSSEICQIPLSQSGVRGMIEKVSQKMEPLYEGIESALPTQSLLHADETGWKVDGNRWYLWFFGNQNIAYFYPDPSRGSKVPKTILGADFPGLLHSDFYSAYFCFAYTQKCLIHYLRDVKEELALSPNEAALQELKRTLKKVMKQGRKFQKRKNKEKAKRQLREMLASVANLQSDNPTAQTLINRIDKYGDSLINFVDLPNAEPHNNLAERAIRPAVIFRKISFGNRSAEGARAFAALTSVLETVRLRGKSPIEFLKELLNTPHEKIPRLTAELLNSS